MLQASFEKSYYVPLGKHTSPMAFGFVRTLTVNLDAAEDSKYNVNSGIINRRGIYKDVFGSGPGREWSDYQFRANFPIAMAVAPELFDGNHALGALQLADKVLRSPLGMKTLDPSDMQYRPYYDNANDSTDPAIAKGLNYHNVSVSSWQVVKRFNISFSGP